jgi:DNA-directed RNA polymerase specialized sigma24 family protein
VAAPPPFEPAGPPFGHWVDARASALGRFAYVLTGSLDAADTAVQDALVTARLAWRRLAADPELDVRLQAMTVRAYLRRRRGRRGARADHADLGDPAPDGWLPAPASSAEPDEEAVLVWQRCAGLPPRRRAALVLRCLEGWSVPEIAAVLGGLRQPRPRTAADLDAALAAVLPEAAGDRHRLERVGQALRQYADTAPSVLAAAERASVRARGRHRRRVAAVSVATALVVPALVWAVSSAGPPVKTPAPDLQGLVASRPHVGGWRWESWGGVEVQVPRSWGSADLTQWCAEHGTSGPAVDRPELRSGHVLCSLYDDGRPTYTAGMLMRWAASSPRLSRADVAPDATTRIFTLGDVTLTLVDVDPAVGDAILASAQVIGSRDHQGCRPVQQLGGAGFLADGPTAALRGGIGRASAVSAVSVCRYGFRGGWSGTRLISSGRLTGAAADRTVAALRAAPVVGRPGRSAHCHLPEREFAVLELWPVQAAGAAVEPPRSLLVRYDGCHGHGLYDGTTVRRLTPRVLRPVTAPPWSGAVAPDLRPLVRAEFARTPRLTRSH